MGARFGRYETLQPIASGGMATVHLARAVGAGGFERLVAIKVMHPGLSADPEFAAMFLDEARVAARIRHGNVVGTVDVQEGPEGLFLVMEYVEGPSCSAILRALRKKGARLPLALGLRILVDALQGLHAAHVQTGAAGEPLHIIHRDVSPQNILVGVDGQTKITDFGVARAESRISSTRRGEVKGKLAYMSPQQLRGEAIDCRADVYAAGVVLWELLTGQRLFTGENDGALLLAVIQGAEDRPPSAVNPSIPHAIDRVCMRALAVDPDARPETALAFAEAIEAAAMEAGIAPANTRSLAAFVQELGAHALTPPPPAAPPPQGVEAPPARDSSVAEPTLVDGDASSHVAAVLASRSPTLAPPAGRKRIGLGLAVIAVVVGAVVALRFAGHVGGDPQPTTAAGTAAASDASSPQQAPPPAADPPRPRAPEPLAVASSTSSMTATSATSATAPAPSGGRASAASPVGRGPRAATGHEWKAPGL